MSEFGKWTKIKDELPPELEKIYIGENYLCTVTGCQVIALKYVKTNVRNKEVIRWEWYGSKSQWEVISWMPFPEADEE